MNENVMPPRPFNFGEAVTQLFRTNGGRGFAWRLILWTSLLATVVYAISVPPIIGPYGDLLTMNWENMKALRAGQISPTSAEDMEIFKALALPYGVLMIGFWLVYASADAALHRETFRGIASSGIPHRFGGDEFRVMLAQFGVWMTLMIVYTLGLFFVMGIGVGGAATSPVLGIILGVVLAIVLLALLMFLAVRLSTAGALSVHDGKARLLAGNKASKGRFWWMTLSYLVTFGGGYMAYIIVMMLFIGLFGKLLGIDGIMDAMMGGGTEDPGPIFDDLVQKFKSPVAIVLGLIIAFAFNVFAAIWFISIAGVGTYVVKLYKGIDRLTTFD